MVTGLILTPDNKISIGRQRKKMIKSMVHKHTISDLSIESTKQLRVLIAFAMDTDPIFILSLKKKYSVERINDIMR